jgi:hypothetical protein
MTMTYSTIVSRLTEVLTELQEKAGNRDPIHTASREFAIAAHHVEDAIMRTNMGFAKIDGIQGFADVEDMIEGRQ